MANKYKIVVFVPESHTDVVRKAMGDAGAGKIGNYTYCSFSSKGIGRFKPEEGANPTIGKVGNLESVEEERIEVVADKQVVDSVLSAIKRVHPYEEVVIDVYPLEGL
ncbi:MAG: YqfO family protein [bacterium]